MAKAGNVEAYISENPFWKEGLIRLRELVLETNLEETIKWGQPTYTLGKKNVLAIGAFKGHFGIWFFNGALLNDPENVLTNAQEGKTKATRQLRFTSPEDIDEAIVRNLIQQAIKNQKMGREVTIDPKREVSIPDELAKNFSNDDELKRRFHDLTPGRQRDYAEYISTARQSKTKQTRLDKIIPMIKSGIGLNDKYQK